MKRKGFTMPLNFLFQLIFAVIILIVIFQFLAKPFMSERRTQTKFQDIMAKIEAAYGSWGVGDRGSVPLGLGKKDYIVLFEKDGPTPATKHSGVSFFITKTTEMHQISDPKGFYIPRPSECKPDKSCLCLCTDSQSQDGLREQNGIYVTSGDQKIFFDRQTIRMTQLSCNAEKQHCKNYDFTVQGNCTTSLKNTALGCEGGILFERSLTSMSSNEGHFGNILIEKPKFDTLVLCKEFPCTAVLGSGGTK